ncbi:MAG: AMP-binding protein [Amphritea sp.]
MTFSHGVPTVLQIILNGEEAVDTDLNGWKLLTGGSAPTLGLAQQMADKGILFHTGYGMSETCPLLSTTFLHPAEREQDMSDQMSQRIKTGVPIGLVDLRIVDPDGNDVPHDGEAMGEIVVRAPWLTQGNYKEPEKEGRRAMGERLAAYRRCRLYRQYRGAGNQGPHQGCDQNRR